MQRKDEIVTIQSLIRGKQARKLYKTPSLPVDRWDFDPAFVAGNDPYMPPELHAYCEADEKIALVATSGMRAVSLACTLGNQQQMPKIILIDYSYRVISFWKKMRDFMADENFAGTHELFINNL